MDLYTNATACINGKGFKPNETCAKCSEDYDKLNKFYTKIRFDTADKLCFDIKDRVRLFLVFPDFEVIPFIFISF